MTHPMILVVNLMEIYITSALGAKESKKIVEDKTSVFGICF